MRQIDLTHPNRVPGSEARVARLTRHLRARLLDFGPGGPEVLSADEAAGAVRARFPGHDAAKYWTGWPPQRVSAPAWTGTAPCSFCPRTLVSRTWTICGAVCLTSSPKDTKHALCLRIPGTEGVLFSSRPNRDWDRLIEKSDRKVLSSRYMPPETADLS